MTSRIENGSRVVGGLTGALGLALAARFLLSPATAAAGYGVPADADDPYLAVKGIRDLGTGLTLFALLARNDSRALGTALLAFGVIPVGDALVVHRHGGPLSVSLGVHGVTAAAMIGAGAALSRTPRPGRSTPGSR